MFSMPIPSGMGILLLTRTPGRPTLASLKERDQQTTPLLRPLALEEDAKRGVAAGFSPRKRALPIYLGFSPGIVLLKGTRSRVP
jgi:hypothetical protein